MQIIQKIFKQASVSIQLDMLLETERILLWFYRDVLFLFGCWAQGPLQNRTKQPDTMGCSWQLGDGSEALPRKMFNVSDVLNSQKGTTKHYYSPSIRSLKWTCFGRISKSQV